jgi:hypothetical protein
LKRHVTGVKVVMVIKQVACLGDNLLISKINFHTAISTFNDGTQPLQHQMTKWQRIKLRPLSSMMTRVA